MSIGPPTTLVHRASARRPALRRARMSPARPTRIVSGTDSSVNSKDARYALYRSYVLLAKPPIELISHPIRAWVPLGKAQRIEEVTYDPLLYLTC